MYPVFEQWAGQGVAMCLTSCRLVNLHAENADSHAQCNFFPPTYCNASGDNLQECDNYFEQEQCSTVKKKKKQQAALDGSHWQALRVFMVIFKEICKCVFFFFIGSHSSTLPCTFISFFRSCEHCDVCS